MIDAMVRAISVSLDAEFGSGYEIYREEKKQGLKGRCHKKTWKTPVKSMFFKGSGKRGGANK